MDNCFVAICRLLGNNEYLASSSRTFFVRPLSIALGSGPTMKLYVSSKRSNEMFVAVNSKWPYNAVFL